MEDLCRDSVGAALSARRESNPKFVSMDITFKMRKVFKDVEMSIMGEKRYIGSSAAVHYGKRRREIYGEKGFGNRTDLPASTSVSTFDTFLCFGNSAGFRQSEATTRSRRKTSA